MRFSHWCQTKFSAFKVFHQKIGTAETLKYGFLRLVTKKGKLIPVKIKGLQTFYVRNKFYDTKILLQLFINDELNFPLPDSPKLIIDCGANIGLAALYLKGKFPDAKIICIEPEDSNFALLRKNTQGYKDIHLHKNGIWERNCTLYIIDNGEGHASFQVSDKNDGSNIVGSVEAISIENIFEQYRLQTADLVKIDIEGSEKVCFEKGDLSWVEKTKCLAVEVHENLFPGCGKLIDSKLNNYRKSRCGEYSIYTKSGAN